MAVATCRVVLPVAAALFGAGCFDFAGYSNGFDAARDGGNDAAARDSATACQSSDGVPFHPDGGAASLGFTLSEVSLGAQTLGIAAGDFDGDGKLDLVLAEDDDTVVIALQAKGFVPQNANQSVPSTPVAIVAADLDGDGLLDVALAMPSAHQVAVLSGKGDGSLTAPSMHEAGMQPVALAAGDVDNDGHLDLVAADMAADSIVLLRGAQGWDNAESFPIGVAPTVVALADFDGDCQLDVVATLDAGGGVSMLKNQGGSYAVLPVKYLTGAQPRGLSPGDFDGDGVLDLAVSHYNDSHLTLLRGIGGGALTTYDQVMVPPAMALIAADWDGDGALDAAVFASFAVRFLRNDGTGHLLDQGVMVACDGALRFAAGDFDGDGRPDTAFGRANDHLLDLLWNRSK